MGGFGYVMRHSAAQIWQTDNSLQNILHHPKNHLLCSPCFWGEDMHFFWNIFSPSLQDVAQVSNLTVEAGGEAVLRCTSSSLNTELVDEAVDLESKGPSNTSGLDKGCKWELDGKEIQLSSTRHSLSSDESHVSVDHVTRATISFCQVHPQHWLY